MTELLTGNTRVTTRIIPFASHGMLEVQTYQGRGFSGAISPRILSALTDWIMGTTIGR